MTKTERCPDELTHTYLRLGNGLIMMDKHKGNTFGSIRELTTITASVQVFEKTKQKKSWFVCVKGARYSKYLSIESSFIYVFLTKPLFSSPVVWFCFDGNSTIVKGIQSKIKSAGRNKLRYNKWSSDVTIFILSQPFITRSSVRQASDASLADSLSLLQDLSAPPCYWSFDEYNRPTITSDC